LIPESIASRVETFVRRRFEVDPNDDDFDRTVDLYDRGYIDSVGFVELLAFLAKEFRVEIPEEDVLSDEFLTIDGIAIIVARLSVEAIELTLD
jgi:D-alanine--poly(phosphoribitol) ligase subunit 2